MNRRRILLFDLDGTLTDSKLGITRCIRYALNQLSIPCPSDDILVSLIGSSSRVLFSSLINTSDADRIEAATNHYRKRFLDKGLYENELYDGIQKMLEDMCDSIQDNYVVTLKPAIYAKRIVKHFGLELHFKGIYGSELDGRFDNKTELLTHLITEEKLSPNIAIMVGDRAADINAAKSNRVRSIGVMWGYGSERELLDAGADALCTHPNKLMSTILKL